MDYTATIRRTFTRRLRDTLILICTIASGLAGCGGGRMEAFTPGETRSGVSSQQHGLLFYYNYLKARDQQKLLLFEGLDGARAISVGDLNDPNSEVSQLIAGNSVKRIREDLGTEPKVHYIGL